MANQLFTVKIEVPDGSETSYVVLAQDEHKAIQRAMKYAGLGKGAPSSATVVIDRKAAIRELGSSGETVLPSFGWMITATTPNGMVVEQQFLVALEDGGQAVAAAQHRADPSFVLALGPRVEQKHMLRRKMIFGDVFELGAQRITRGKNTPREK